MSTVKHGDGGIMVMGALFKIFVIMTSFKYQAYMVQKLQASIITIKKMKMISILCL